MKLRYKLMIIAVFLVGIFMWGRHSKKVPTAPNPAAVLPKEDKEQILVDPVNHTLIIVKPTGNDILTLPDHPSTIDIRKDGTVKVTSPQFGWEHRFFFGIQGSRDARLAVGMDAYYFKRLDIGIGVADQLGQHTPILFPHISYNFWSNCRIGVEYGTDRYIGGTLTVRL